MGGNLPDEDLKTIIVVEYYYGRNGKTRSNDNPEGVVNRCLYCWGRLLFTNYNYL